jgi:hypothetical protein
MNQNKTKTIDIKFCKFKFQRAKQLTNLFLSI